MNPPLVDLSKYVTIAEAAKEAGVAEDTIRAWIRRGNLRTLRHFRYMWCHIDDVYDAELAARQRDRTGTATRRISGDSLREIAS